MQLLLLWVRISLFPIYMATIVKKRNFFNTIIKLSIQTIANKIGVKQIDY